MAGPDKLVIMNADGSFADPRVEQYLAGLIQYLIDASPGGGGPPLTSYSQVSSLPDYPGTFPPSSHGHPIADISPGFSSLGLQIANVVNSAALRALAVLDNVNNTSDANKPISTAQASVNSSVAATLVALGNADAAAALHYDTTEIVVLWSGTAWSYPTKGVGQHYLFKSINDEDAPQPSMDTGDWWWPHPLSPAYAVFE